MGINEALEQLEEIHQHVNRSEVYRGYRSGLTAFIGLLALVGAFLQPRFAGAAHPLSYVYFWVAVAAAGFLVPMVSILFHFTFHESALQRRKTRQAVGQFIPCLLAGALLTFAVCNTNEGFIVFLPGLWSLLFGMGVHASKPYLPGAIHWMAVSFFAGGVILLALVPSGQSLSPWGLGMVFGVGLLLGAFILYFSIERKSHEKR